MNACTSYMIFCDFERLNDPVYFALICARYGHTTHVKPHVHTCSSCRQVIRHTRIEALRDGDLASHRCCGADVRDRKEPTMQANDHE